MSKIWGRRIARFSQFPMFRKLATSVAFFTIYGALECAFEQYYLGYDFAFPAGVHTLLGVALSILMVFRTNATYDRWWEARKLWGTLVNVSRSLALIVVNLPVPENEKRAFAEAQSEFAFAFRDHLRLAEQPARSQPIALMQKMSALNQKWLGAQLILPHQWSNVEMRLTTFSDVLGACERIRRTPLPSSHRAIIPQALVLYLLILPWGLPDHWTVPLIVGATAYFMLSLEFIAEELEQPFGTDPDDLPLGKYATGIAGSMQQIYGPAVDISSIPQVTSEPAGQGLLTV